MFEKKICCNELKASNFMLRAESVMNIKNEVYYELNTTKFSFTLPDALSSLSGQIFANVRHLSVHCITGQQILNQHF